MGFCKLQCSFDDLIRTCNIVQDIESMMSARMGHEVEGHVLCTCFFDKRINGGGIDGGMIDTCSGDEHRGQFLDRLLQVGCRRKFAYLIFC